MVQKGSSWNLKLHAVPETKVTKVRHGKAETGLRRYHDSGRRGSGVAIGAGKLAIKNLENTVGTGDAKQLFTFVTLSTWLNRFVTPTLTSRLFLLHEGRIFI